MNKLAVELLTLISFYACVDGGRTGCMLSVVSKRIRSASRPARFFSVSLMNGPAQVEQFLKCYQAERNRATEALPRVRHLCLSLFGKGLNTGTSLTSASQGQSGLGPSTSQAMSRMEFFAALQRRTQHWRSAQENLDEQYNHVIPTLIRAVAPDVQTFALVQAQWRSSSVIRCYFPSLREFTIVGGDPSFLPFSFVPTDRPLYPALKRLHHILAFVGKDVDFMQWALHAPKLSHLRVSRLDYHPAITVDTLEQTISECRFPGPCDGDGSPMIRRAAGDAAADEIFPSLQEVMIEPHPAPPLARSTSTAHLAFRDFLVHLQRVAERAKVPVLVLPPLEMPKIVPGADPHRMCIMRVNKEWMERVEADGAGCWEEGRRARKVAR